ncbi:two-component sensor histidine kinase [Virgisporangium aliadipatigenens]|uniref:histidine kinase n=1 Tax=Virgisporangium aliadipatigenens TaxID=741659 RepID=A0A8J3YJU4_9ACTN|nr:two-component sensor histidine kinase [Virgisporangium aliadipatigenens]
MLRHDLLLAAGIAAVELVLLVINPVSAVTGGRGLLIAIGWLAIVYAVLPWRRLYPWFVVNVVALHTLVASFDPATLPGSAVGVMLVTYTVASRRQLSAAVTATLAIWVPATLVMVVTGGPELPNVNMPVAYSAIGNLMVALIVFFVGRTVHIRRAYVAALEDRATTAEANQRTLAEQAVAEERRRIARELHDVVAHHVSVMSVLATGTRRTMRRDPAAADEALTTIEETGRVALREMRRLLTVLRTEAEPAGELEPQPGLPGLSALCEQIREAGLPVGLTVAGEPGPLDPGVALTVYRIVQEALTNALKHAGPAATAEVRLNFTPKELTIEISDNGRGPHPSGDDHIGHGLLGMRERISLYGGTLRTGPRPGGGYRVSVCIPMDNVGASHS